MSVTRKLMNREAFMGFFIASVGGVGGLVLGIPIIGSILGPLINQPSNVWRDLGPVSDFKVGETVKRTFQYPGTLQWAGPTKETATWIRRLGPSEFQAFAVYCTHLGCPVNWLQTPQIFLCPCHGSVFNGQGDVAGGPAQRPLFKYETRVRNGRVEILTTAQPEVT